MYFVLAAVKVDFLPIIPEPLFSSLVWVIDHHIWKKKKYWNRNSLDDFSRFIRFLVVNLEEAILRKWRSICFVCTLHFRWHSFIKSEWSYVKLWGGGEQQLEIWYKYANQSIRFRTLHRLQSDIIPEITFLETSRSFKWYFVKSIISCPYHSRKKNL